MGGQLRVFHALLLEKPCARLQIRNDQRCHVVAIQACNHHILRDRRQRRDQVRPQWPDAYPCPARELEILGDPAVEHESTRRITLVEQADGITHPVIAFFVERGRVSCGSRQ